MRPAGVQVHVLWCLQDVASISSSTSLRFHGHAAATPATQCRRQRSTSRFVSLLVSAQAIGRQRGPFRLRDLRQLVQVIQCQRSAEISHCACLLLAVDLRGWPSRTQGPDQPAFATAVLRIGRRLLWLLWLCFRMLIAPTACAQSPAAPAWQSAPLAQSQLVPRLLLVDDPGAKSSRTACR